MSLPAEKPFASWPPELLTDALVFGYALWTVACHAVVLLEGTPRIALTGAALVAATCFAGVILLLRWRKPWREAYLRDLEQAPQWALVPLTARARLLVLLSIPLVVVTWYLTRNSWIVWIQVLLGYCAVSIYGLKLGAVSGREDEVSVPGERRVLVVVFVAAAASAIFTLLAFRPRSDECFYLSVAISVSDYPEQALLKFSTVHGPATAFLPVQHLYPPYRVHSFELLGGYLSYLSGIDAVNIVHFFIAPFFGFFVPLAIARLLKLLTPRYWLGALFIVLSFYLIEGTADRGYANQAFVRLFNGKSVMLTVGVPLLFAYGLRFGAKPSRWRFALLVFTQISALGMSSTGIWLAPAIAMISVLVAIPALRVAPRTMAMALLSSAYVLLMGIWVAAQMGVGGDADSASAVDRSANFGLLGYKMRTVLGGERTVIAHLSGVALACVLARNAATWRLFASLGLVMSAVMANPFFVNQVTRFITGLQTYQRIFWLVPVPVALGLWCTGAFHFIRNVARTRLSIFAILMALLAYYWVATERLVISHANHAQIKIPPRVKMWPRNREIAERVCQFAPKGTRVLAPKGISQQLITVHDCGFPLIATMRWMSAPIKEERRRNKLVRLVSEVSDIRLNRTEWFVEWINKYRITAIVMNDDGIRNRWVRTLIKQTGFEKVEYLRKHHIWVFDPKPSWTLRWHRTVAGSTCKRSPQGTIVLAPFGVSRQIALSGCAKPLIAYHAPEESIGLSPDELRRLDELISRDEDIPEDETEWLSRAIVGTNVGSVVLYKKAFKNLRVKSVLDKLGFRKVKTVEYHEIWVRGTSPSADGGRAAAN
jgi:hypothetical protein